MGSVSDGFEPDTPRAGFEVHGFDESDRARLAGLLHQYGVAHEFVRPELQVPAAESELAEDLIALVRSPEGDAPPPSPWGRGGQAPPSSVEAALAPRGLRFVA